MPRSERPIAIVSLPLAFLGNALSVSWLLSVTGPPAMLIVAAILTALWWIGLTRQPTPGRFASVARGAFVLSLGYHAMATYVAVSVAIFLGWVTPLWLRCLVMVLLAFSLIPLAIPRLRRQRVPTILPIGLWIAACLAGWWREDGVVRCDDYQRAVMQPGVSVAIPSTLELPQCQAGEVLRVARYPRRVWESTDLSRTIITTQPAIGKLLPPGRPAIPLFTGSVCAVDAGDPSPHCLGEGKTQAILDDSSHDHVYVPGWSQRPPNLGVLYRLPVHGPWRVLAQAHVQKNFGEAFLDPELDLIGWTPDEGGEILFVRPSTMEILFSQEADIQPEETHYDAARHEGVFCANGSILSTSRGLAMAFQGSPFTVRMLGGAWPWSRLGIMSSCDWDPETRRVYVALGNLGLLATIDYDDGAVLQWSFVGLGARHMVLDRPRGRIYVSNFLRGDVQAVDLESGQQLDNWFIGRFVRFVSLSRDGKWLYAPSTIGVVRVALD